MSARSEGSDRAFVVLHVDDEPSFADTAAEYLERELDDVTVVTASSADDGIEVLRDREIDCVVSDYEMPGSDGVAFLERVRAHDEDLPFILFTGKGSEEIASEAISAGVTDYLQKDVDPSKFEVLAHRIRNAVERYRSERELAETERKLMQLAERSDDVLFMFDADWSEVLFVNSAFEELWGVSSDEVEEEPLAFLDSIHPDDREGVRERMEKLAAGEEATAEYRVLRDEDDVRHVRADSRPILDDDGEVERIVGYVRDITDRRERERALERQNEQLERYQEIVETFDDIAVVADGDRRVTYVNDRFNDYFDVDQGVIQEQEVDALADVYVTNREDQEQLREALDRAFETTDRDGAPQRLELTLDTARGARTFEAQISPIADGDDVVALVGLLRDVTERVEREQALEETTERLESVIEASPDAIMVVDIDGRVTMWNEAAEEIFGWSEDEILGEPNPIIPEDLEEEFEDHRKRAFGGEGISGKETRRVTKDGETLHVSLSTAPVRDADEEVVGGMAVIEDITERKRHERRLEAIVENTINPIYIKDDAGTYRFVNHACAAAWGLDPEDVVGCTDDELFDAASAEEVRERDRRVMETGEGITEEMALTIEGEEAVFLDNKFPFRDSEGEIIGTMGVAHDITERKQRERQLERYERIIDNLPVGVYRTAAEGEIIDVNQAVAEISGYGDPDAMEGRDVTEFYADPARREELTAAVERGDTVHGMEVETENADGDDIWVEVTTTAVEEDGEVYYDGIIRDVTERKQRESRLERYERIVENLPVAVYRTDESGTILDANPQAVAVIGGESEDQVVGKNVLELYADEDGRDEITDQLVEEGRIDAAEVEAQTLDGDAVWLQITSRRVEEGDDVYYDGIARDVTDRKLRERELERARELLAQAQDVADVGGWSFDLSGDPPHHPEWTDNMYDLLAFPHDEEPPPLDEMIDRYLDEDRERRDAEVERALDRGEEWDVESRIRCFDGEVKWVREIARPEFRDGELVRVRGSFQDVTERKEREREIEQQNERLQEFAEVVSHDLRNPLNVAQGQLDLAVTDDEVDEAHLDEVAAAHDRMAAIIEDLLVLARQGEDSMETEAVDLERAARVAWDHVPTRDAALETETTGEIVADRSRLHEVLENLYRNAVEHGGDDVTVTVIEREDGFAVQDDGAGFGDADLEQIFETGHSTATDGTGFGLAIVERIADLHGWSVHATMGGSGGARFEFTDVETP